MVKLTIYGSLRSYVHLVYRFYSHGFLFGKLHLMCRPDIKQKEGCCSSTDRSKSRASVVPQIVPVLERFPRACSLTFPVEIPVSLAKAKEQLTRYPCYIRLLRATSSSRLIISVDIENPRPSLITQHQIFLRCYEGP
jgi:hypothetical protein